MLDELILVFIIAFIILFFADTVWVLFLRKHPQTALIEAKLTKMDPMTNITLFKYGRRYCVILIVAIAFINLLR